MKLVTSYGGHSIGVYNAESKDKTKVYKMMRDERIKYFAPADYTEGTELDLLVKAIINRTAANEALEALYYKYKIERIKADKESNEEERKRTDLLIALENSGSFATTHSLISKLQEIDDWSYEEKEILFQIALDNSQVRYILHDLDVEAFYKKLLKSTKTMTSNAQEIKEQIIASIDRIHTKMPCIGQRKILTMLRKEGFADGHFLRPAGPHFPTSQGILSNVCKGVSENIWMTQVCVAKLILRKYWSVIQTSRRNYG